MEVTKFKVVEFKQPFVIIKGNYTRPDIAAVFWQVNQRINKGVELTGIPISEWNQFKNALRELKGVSLDIPAEIWVKLDDYLNAPTYKIELKEDHIAIRNSHKSSQYDWKIRCMSGCVFDASNNRNYFKLNSSEAYNIFEVMEGIPNVVYDEGVQEYIIKQVEDRSALDKIAKLEDADFDNTLVQGLSPRPFQKVGVKFIETTNGRALLGDEMGLGKTWQALMYAQAMKFQKVIVVCPASLRINWAREIYKLTGEFPYILSGTIPTNHDITKLMVTPPRFIICNYDILGRKKDITSVKQSEDGIKHVKNDVLWPWVEVLKLYKAEFLIIDEAHYMKNPAAQRTQALLQMGEIPKVLAMTGTPVLNRPGELWPILNILYPGQFPVYETFLRQYTYDNKRARNVETLRKVLKNIMIRRLKKDVVKELPPINRINEYVELSEGGRKAYNKVMEGIYKTMESWGQGIKQSEVTNILTQLLRLKQVCAFDKMEFVAELATEIYDSASEGDYKKVLIFSQFVDVAEGIARRLGNECVNFCGKDSQAERMKLVDEFQTNDDIHFLVATTKVASEGLNLTKAGTVIFTDLMWTPASHSQAEGRAYGRIADSHSINSYYVICEKTIEEDILELLKFKSGVIAETTEELNKDRDESVAMDIIKKIKEEMWTFKKM